MPAPPDWMSTVVVRRDPDLGAELAQRLERSDTVRAVGVSDLLALRRAYWRATTAPLEIPRERRARLDVGRWLHRHLDRVFGESTALEVRVRSAGCVGRIDGLADIPIEVKTGASVVEPADLATLRPDHVEQLAMYCAMIDRPVGRLLQVSIEGAAVGAVRTADVRFRALASVREEMGSRAAALQRAIADGTPVGLPRCRWFGRGCEYQVAGRCDCLGSEPDPPSRVLEELEAVGPRSDLDREYGDRIGRLPSPGAPPVLERFRDLLYPRRAYFERTSKAPERSMPPARPAERPDLYLGLVGALESGPVGDVARLAPRSGEPEEEVTGFRGLPFLLRTSRAWEPIAPDELLRRAPQYALELGYRCAVTGARRGRIVLGYDRASNSRDRVDVLDLEFASVTPFARRVRQGRDALAQALQRERPDDLPACPSWMVADCPYAAECGCGEPSPRSQR